MDRLVSDVQAGINAERAFRELFRRFYAPVVRFFGRRGFSDAESQELAQETFVSVYKGIGQFRRQVRFEHWLFQIAANIRRNELRRRKALRRGGKESTSANSIEPAEPPASDLDSPGTVGNPLTQFLDNELLTVVRGAIDELPTQRRRCILLRVDGLPYDEIAELLRLSPETVKSHLAKARKSLKLRLSNYFPHLTLFDQETIR